MKSASLFKVRTKTFCVLITNEMHNYYNQFFFIPQFFCLLYMIRKNLVVHHQQHGIICYITQFGRIGTIVQASLTASI